MVGTFKNNYSSNLLLLIGYALVLKSGLFLHPAAPLLTPEDGLLYRSWVAAMERLSLPSWVYALLTFLFLLIQALLFNRICNDQKFFSRPNYLWAMSFLLLTSLVPAWNRFSAVLLLNFLLIWLFYRLITLNDQRDPMTRIYNAGLLVGAAVFLSKPALLFMLLLLLALFLFRPFQIREWLLALLGLATPFYFLGVYSFLNDEGIGPPLFSWLQLHRPVLSGSLLYNLSFLQILLVFIVGGFIMQGNLNKMLIQARKNWTLLILYLITSALSAFFYQGPGRESWLLSAIPLAGFHAAAFYFPEKKFFPLFLHWAMFGYALLVNFWV